MVAARNGNHHGIGRQGPDEDADKAQQKEPPNAVKLL